MRRVGRVDVPQEAFIAALRVDDGAPGRRRSERRGHLRPRPVLPDALRLLRLQRVRGARSPGASVPASARWPRPTLSAPAWDGDERRERVPGRGDADDARRRRTWRRCSRTCARRSTCADDAEVTTEANPDTVDGPTLEALAGRRATGASRWARSRSTRSVLASLERMHQPDVGPPGVRRRPPCRLREREPRPDLRRRGRNASSRGSATLRETVALAPEHISAYALTIEPATPLGRAVAARRAARARPRPAGGHVRLACEVLASAGYRHYEVSNWAKPGFECRHNLGYWERRPYLGLGAGAHSYRDDHRWWNIRPPEEYMAQVEAGRLPVGGEERLDPSDAYLEEVFLKLRILEGDPRELDRRGGRRAVPRERPARRTSSAAGPHRARDAPAERARAGAHGGVHRLTARHNASSMPHEASVDGLSHARWRLAGWQGRVARARDPEGAIGVHDQSGFVHLFHVRTGARRRGARSRSRRASVRAGSPSTAKVRPNPSSRPTESTATSSGQRPASGWPGRRHGRGDQFAAHDRRTPGSRRC